MRPGTLTGAAQRADHGDVWTSYSARAAAQLIGLPESAIRRCIRDGLVGSPDDVPARLTFRDLAALRALRSLVDGGVPLARARRDLLVLARGLPEGTSLAEVPVEVRGGRVHVRGRTATGQLELPLEAHAAPPPAGEVHVLRAAIGGGPAATPPAIAPAPPLTADDWFARALALEDSQAPGAIDAYRRALRQRPEWVEAWVNLGRLLAESDDPTGARECFESALALDPADATALYNLGVVAQDTGRVEEAIAHYGRALELDDALAEAHYNLATLFDQQGDGRAAIRHINAYRKLTRGS